MKARMKILIFPVLFAAVGLMMPDALAAIEDQKLERETDQFQILGFQGVAKNPAYMAQRLMLVSGGYTEISENIDGLLSEEEAFETAEKGIRRFMEKDLTDLGSSDLFRAEATSFLAVSQNYRSASAVLWKCRFTDTEGRSFEVMVDDASEMLVSMSGIPIKNPDGKDMAEVVTQWGELLNAYYGFADANIKGVSLAKNITSIDTSEKRYLLLVKQSVDEKLIETFALSFSIKENLLYFNCDVV